VEPEYSEETRKGLVAQMGYLGTRSVHVWSQYDINPSVYIQGSTAQRTNDGSYPYKIQPWVNITAPFIQAILVATENTMLFC